ncbi:hypothetical protein MYBA111488_15965 [Mycobacterium basiliense]
MDVVLGVSLAPAAVRMALVEGQDGNGLIVEEDSFPVGGDSTIRSATDQVIDAILGTREGAAEAGLQLSAIGVSWTDHLQAAALRDALAVRKIENVMLVSGFLAAAALGQTVGGAVGYDRTAVLFIEPDTVTLAVVDTSDGSVSDVRQQLLSADDDTAVAEVVALVAAAESMPARPDGLYVVGTGVDVAMIKPVLDASTSLTVNVPEEHEMALARGAALASGNAPLFASSTAALAYAQDVRTPDFFDQDELGYHDVVEEDSAGRRSGLLVGSGLAVVATAAVVALEVALAMDIRPTVALQPRPNENHLVAPAEPAEVPTQVAAPAPRINVPQPSSGVPQLPAPLPAASIPPAPEAPDLPAAAEPIFGMPAAPVVPAPRAPDPIVAIPPLVPIVVPPVRVPNAVSPAVPKAPTLVPRQQPRLPKPRVQVPVSPPRIVNPIPRGPIGQTPPGRGSSPKPGRVAGGGRGGHGPGGLFGGGGHGGPFGGGGQGGFGGGHGGGFGGGHGGGFGGGHGRH